ncbi:MAG TPA: hypothetical protein VFZ22_00200 [Pyrinomonadaceae bacterium]|nr:hypothetical protein [Pyrinomonadaceae bacterium]
MNFKLLLVMVLAISLTGTLSFVSTTQVAAQGGSTALERGYRTGYSDGYTAGFRDLSDHAARDYQNKQDYQRADRSYNEVWGPIEDYRDGYQQGFENGYAAGFDNQQFNSTLPAGLRRRGNGAPSPNAGNQAPVPNANNTSDNPAPVPNNSDTVTNDDGVVMNSSGPVAIPRNTTLALEMLTPISTDVSQRGDRFQARVLQPAQYAGYIVDGRIAQIKRPGKVKGVAQLQLAFDQIRSPDNRTASLRAELVEITPMGDNDPQVDSEGGVKGRDSTKDDAAKVGAASGIGAIIGVIAGGGKGAAIGAIIGGGAGTAGVMTQRGKDIRLERGQQLKIRTSTDTGVQ